MDMYEVSHQTNQAKPYRIIGNGYDGFVHQILVNDNICCWSV